MTSRIVLIMCMMALLLLTAGCRTATPAVTAVQLPTAKPTPLPATQTPRPSETEAEPLETTLPAQVRLQYIGHACFMLTDSDGYRIILDPYRSYSVPVEIEDFPAGLEAELVTISHFHSDHGNVLDIGGKPGVIFDVGLRQAGQFTIIGYQSDHGLLNDVPTGENIAFVFEVGEIKIVHLGAAGVITQEDLLKAIEGADVVIMDADGSAAPNPAHPVAEMIDQLRQSHVRTIIPSHYSFSEKARFNGSITVKEFLEMLPKDLKVKRPEASELVVTGDMPEQVLVLAPWALSQQK